MKKSNLLKDNKELIKEYDYDKNKEFDLDKLTLGSDRKVWWKCSKGHSWQAGIGSRNRMGVGCPVCANLQVLKGYNDLESQCPKVAKEWNYDKNDINPDEIVYVSMKKVWWKCKNGHEWEAVIRNRTKENGTNCPYCANQKILKGYNDLATENPSLAAEWNYEMNGFAPTEIGSKSSKKVWWKCKNGHEWQQVIEVRNRGIGCPYCSGKKIAKGENDLFSKYPRIAKEWDYTKNKEKPNEVFPSSSKLFWWICPKGHSYKQTAGNRIQNHGCPICSKEKVTSFQEKIVYYYVKKYFSDSVDNYRINELGKREIDVFIPSLNVGIEYDGGYYHIDIKSDIKKDRICDKLGIKLYRIRDNKCAKLNSTSICFYRKNKSNSDLELILRKLLIELGVVNPIINIDRDLENIYNEIDYSEKEKSLQSVNPDLAAEWNTEKNGNLNPKHVLSSSSKKVWWKCSKGHEWQATINHRNKGQKCPYCSGHKVLTGFNDLATTHSELLKEWDYDKNSNLLPSEVTFGSSKVVWWKCEKGHSYRKTIKAKSRSERCPICYPLTKNDINEVLRKIKQKESEWDVVKNEKSLEESVHKITEKVWWKCSKGHSYEMSILDRYKNFGCPYCSGHRVLSGFNDLATTNSELLKEWDYAKNLKKPDEISSGSSYKAYWKCSKGHEWQAVISARTSGSGCPYCNSNAIKVNQYTEAGKFLRQFNSCKDAGKSVGISGRGINYACKSKSLTKGFQWRFDQNDLTDIEVYVNNNKCIKRVMQFDLQGNYIKTFDGVRKAMDETGAKKVSEVCKGKRKTSGGYIWKYE